MITIKLTPAQVSALECREGGGFDEGCLLRWGWHAADRKAELAFICAGHVHLAADSATEYANCEDAQAEELRYSDPVAARGPRGACIAFTNLATKLRKEAAKYAST